MPQAGETQLSTQSAPPPTGFVEADFGTEISRFPIEKNSCLNGRDSACWDHFPKK